MQQHIQHIELPTMAVRFHNPEIAHEREAAIRDLLHENQFQLVNGSVPPYHMRLEMLPSRLNLHLYDPQGEAVHTPLAVSMRPFQPLIKDYFIIWESYSLALRTAAPEKLQAIDMGRRAIHNEGAELLQKRLQAEVDADFETLRRLFTLICVLHIK